MPALAATFFLVAGSLCELRNRAAQLVHVRRPLRLGLPMVAVFMLAANGCLLLKASRLTHRPYQIQLVSLTR